MKNFDFEQDWDGSHRCLIKPIDGDIYETDVGSIFTPPGWLTFFYHDPGRWDQPEVRDARKEVDPRRVYSGEKAMLMFSFHRHHDGGFLQTVDIAPGSKVRFSAMAHAWSNCHDRPNTDDPRWSEGPGFDDGFLLEGTAPNDDWRNFRFCVGIDPTGGTDPYSDVVIYGTAAHIYNGYFEIPPLEAVAVSDKITVFLRCTCAWPFKHNDAYFDAAKLEIIEEPAKRRGDPRVQYERSYVLLPPGSNAEWAHAVVTGSWDKHRYTIGGSADDAGIGDLDKRNAIVVNPDWWLDDIQEFINSYYEGVNYLPIVAETPEELAMLLAGDTPPNKWEKYVMWQKKPIWAGNHFGADTCTLTIGQAGCFVVNLSVTEVIYGLDPEATPVTTDAKLTPAGYTGCLALWSAINEKLRLTIKIGSTDAAREHLAAGKVVMARVLPTNPMHFVLVVEYTGDDYLILDPLYGEVALLSNRYDGIHSWRLLDKADTVPSGRHLAGLHIQSNVPGIENFIEVAQPSIIKLVSGMETAIRIKELSPNTKVIYRHHVDEQPMDGDPRVLMQNYLNKFKDSLKLLEGYVWGTESYNETTPSNNEYVVARSAILDAAFAEVLADSGIDVKPVLLNIAVGNPLQSELPLLLPAVDAAVKYGGALGYHAYWWGNRNVSGLASWWKWHAGRWQEQDKYFRSEGYRPLWMFGECGVVGSADGYTLLPSSGWKNSDCLNGDWPRYRGEVGEFDSWIVDWNLTHQDRVLGYTLFTTGAHYTGWESFQIQEAEMNSLLEL